MKAYDDIVVGAGSAGCVLANRLSADPACQVLLVEAGGSDRTPAAHIPKGLAFLMGNPKYSWMYETEPMGPLGATQKWWRGKILGGSSSINGMVYNRGSAADWDGLEALGNKGWGWAEMLPIYRAMEDHQLGESDMRGAGGPLHISVATKREQVSEALIGASGKLGMARVDDLNASDDERVAPSPANIRRGLRQSASTVFLKPARGRSNLTVMTGSVATRLILEGDRAAAVEIVNGGAVHAVRARREIVLCLGNMGTPQLLELSGIGSADVLKAAGVEVRLDRARVGEGMHEHQFFSIQARLNENIGYNRLLHTPGRQARAGLRYLATRTGPVATPAFDLVGFLKSSDVADRPDSQILLTPFSMGSARTDLGVEDLPGLTILGYPLRPTSTGSTHIRSGDPHELPRIAIDYLQTEHDRRIFVDLFRKMREILAQDPIADLIVRETVPGYPVQDDEAILAAGLINGGTSYHASGACAMGPDEEAVADDRLRVRGVEGLRIMDASVLPTMVAGNLNAPMMAMAWRAADIILEDA